jgi:hypothetical protein
MKMSSTRRTASRGYYVYVVELDDAVGARRDPNKPCVYVGQSTRPPRFGFSNTRMGTRRPGT